MIITREITASGDLSNHKQNFKKLDIKILCCRYWWCDIWKGKEMSYPFWRLYWNKTEGAYVEFNKKVSLLPNKLYLISPNTPFSNGIHHQQLKGNPDYFFKCGRVRSLYEEENKIASGSMLHFFVHFTLGNLYNGSEPGVFEITLENGKLSLIKKIISFMIHDDRNFNPIQSIWLNQLLTSSLLELPDSVWKKDYLDNRLRQAVQYMEKNMHFKLTNPVIAKHVNMAPSSFVRLFKDYFRKTPSKYLLEIRLKHAAEMLTHTSIAIEDIAQRCGFTDRYHLTRLFPQKYGLSPAAYRKKLVFY